MYLSVLNLCHYYPARVPRCLCGSPATFQFATPALPTYNALPTSITIHCSPQFTSAFGTHFIMRKIVTLPWDWMVGRCQRGLGLPPPAVPRRLGSNIPSSGSPPACYLVNSPVGSRFSFVYLILPADEHAPQHWLGHGGFLDQDATILPRPRYLPTLPVLPPTYHRSNHPTHLVPALFLAFVCIYIPFSPDCLPPLPCRLYTTLRLPLVHTVTTHLRTAPTPLHLWRGLGHTPVHLHIYRCTVWFPHATCHCRTTNLLPITFNVERCPYLPPAHHACRHWAIRTTPALPCPFACAYCPLPVYVWVSLCLPRFCHTDVYLMRSYCRTCHAHILPHRFVVPCGCVFPRYVAACRCTRAGSALARWLHCAAYGRRAHCTRPCTHVPPHFTAHAYFQHTTQHTMRFLTP